MSEEGTLLICMMGLPRSGKSTVARVLFKARNAPIVNRDAIRLALHGQRYVKAAEPMVRAIAKVMVESLFRAGHAVVIVDETNLKEETRNYWRDGDWDTSFLFIPASVGVCLARANESRDEAIRPVIQRMAEYSQLLRAEEARYEIASEDVAEALRLAVGKD